MQINRKTIRQSRHLSPSAATRSILALLLLAGGLLSSGAQAATLTVSNVTQTGATVTISGHTGDWWYQVKRTYDQNVVVPCTAAAGTTVHLSGLSGIGQYEVVAFGESTCTTVVASAPIITASLAVFSVKPTAARLVLFNTKGWDWWYQGTHVGASCTAISGRTALIADLDPGTSYAYRAYIKSGCASADEVASNRFTTPAAGTTTLTVSDVMATTATLTIADHTGAWWLDGNMYSCTAVASGETSVDLTGLQPFVFNHYYAYDKAGCRDEDEIASEAWSALGLRAINVMATTGTLELLNYTGTWWYANQNGGSCEEVSSGTTRPDLTNLTPNTSYNYKAYGKSGCTLADTIASATFTTGVGPAVPSGLTATGGDGSVTLTWDDPSDPSITGYEVQMRWTGVAWGEWTPIANSGSSTTSHDVTDLTNDTEYRFHLRAMNAGGASVAAPNAKPWYVAATPAASQPPTAPPETPSSVTVTRADGSLTASWPAVDGATSYHITYSSDGGANWSLAALNHPDASITISSVTNSATYIVAVRARNAQGDSGWRNSSPAGPFTPAAPPETPSSVTVTRADGSLTASWPAVDGATSYHITYSSDGGTSWSLAALNHPDASITISSVTNSLTYIVGVRARNAQGDSDWSNSSPTGPFTPAAPPATPSSVTVTRADGSLTASWPAVDGATSYHITYSSDGGTSWTLAALNHPSASITISSVTNSLTYIVGVRARNDQGDSDWRNSSPAGPFTSEASAMAKATVRTPTAFGLADNYPNPFNPSTTIGYVLPAEAEVRLEVFNIAGQRVRVLLDTHQPAGHYTVEWDSRNAQGQAVASGMYFYRLQASTDAATSPFHDVKRMLLIR